MKQTNIYDAVSKLHLTDTMKRRIKNTCYLAQFENERKHVFHTWSSVGLRTAVIICCLLILSVSVYAAAEISRLYVKKDGSTVTVSAAIESESNTESTPIRAWNSAEGEISVKLVFGYMPNDMTENKTANGKWNGSDNTRSITFSGFDLRRGDLSDVIENINNTKAFTAGENDAYLLYDASEAALYDMYLFVHFAEEQLVVKARVGCGITDEEIRSIAAAMRIEETDDAALALPISNELTTENQNNDPLFSFEEESQVIHRTTLLSVGESAHYDGVFGDHKEITVDSIEVLDNISTLDQTGFTSRGLEMLSSFTDNGGNFITYMRTEIDRERGVFGEMTETEKRFVLVSVTLSGAEGEGDAKSFMQTFHLSSCIDGGNGTVLPWYAQASYVIDKNPGRYAGTTEPIYRLNIGNGRYLIGYILDEEISKQTLLLHSSYAEIGYILETE